MQGTASTLERKFKPNLMCLVSCCNSRVYDTTGSLRLTTTTQPSTYVRGAAPEVRLSSLFETNISMLSAVKQDLLSAKWPRRRGNFLKSSFFSVVIDAGILTFFWFQSLEGLWLETNKLWDFTRTRIPNDLNFNVYTTQKIKGYFGLAATHGHGPNKLEITLQPKQKTYVQPTVVCA